MRRFKFSVGQVVAPSKAGLALFDHEDKNSWAKHSWKHGAKFRILKKFPDRHDPSADEYLVDYECRGSEGRYQRRLIDERWELVP